MQITKKLRDKARQLDSIEERVVKLQEALGRVESRQLFQQPTTDLRSSEFRVFSQWGEDGIIQYLVRSVPIARRVFVEFGVQTYVESSTRFLLVNDNWSGLVIDGDAANIDYIKNDPIYWRYNLKAHEAFITRENINELIASNGIRGEIGLLSVDIDGNDYWVWEAIDVVNPAIVITEYNARFGPEACVTIPYDPAFVRDHAHPSMIYYGASLGALCALGKRKGYALVGCNSSGNNAFFVRRDLLPQGMRELSAAEGFVRHQFRESRDATGKLTFEPPETERVPDSLPLVHIE